MILDIALGIVLACLIIIFLPFIVCVGLFAVAAFIVLFLGRYVLTFIMEYPWLCSVIALFVLTIFLLNRYYTDDKIKQKKNLRQKELKKLKDNQSLHWWHFVTFSGWINIIFWMFFIFPFHLFLFLLNVRDWETFAGCDWLTFICLLIPIFISGNILHNAIMKKNEFIKDK